MNKGLSAILLITLGVVTLLAWFGIISSSQNQILGFILLLYGITSTNIFFVEPNRRRMIFSVIIFFIGIVLLVQSGVDIPDKRGIVFVSILFISGSILLMLFVENAKTKSFAYAGVLLIAISIVSLLFFRRLGLFRFTNEVADLANYLWPAILIAFGFVMFSARKK